MKNGINSILVLGDSILKGAVTGTESGHLFDIIENSSLNLAQKALCFEMNNLSVFGNIISKAQKKLCKVLERGEKADLAIIEFGGNDCDYDWPFVSENPCSENISPRTECEDFIRILGEITSLLRENKITPLLMSMPPLLPDCWFDHICNGNNRENILKFLKGNPHKLYENHERYNLELCHFAVRNNVQLVDMRLAFLSSSNYRDLMCKDGIHPNEKGYEYMSKIWIEKLPLVKKEF